MGGIRKLRTSAAVLAVVGMAFGVAGCGSSGDPVVESSTKSSTSTPATTTIARDDALASLLPEALRTSGTMTVGTNVPYEPNEFLDRSGRLVGFDIDLMNAVGQVLGVRPDYQRMAFASMLDKVSDGGVDAAISSITDTSEREKSMDFVTYFNSGVSWASRTNDQVTPGDACGKRVVVKAGTVADRVDVAARSKACTSKGDKLITVVRVADQDAVAPTLQAGKADAMAADYEVTAYEVKKAGGALTLAPGVFLSQPYGIALKKGSPLVEPIRGAVQSLMDSGDYQRIADKWGVGAGTIPGALVNGSYG